MGAKLKALATSLVGWVKREPAQVWLGWVAAALGSVATWGLPFLTAEQAALVVAVVNAVAAAVAAWKIKPASPAIFTGVITTFTALLAGYGVHVSQDVVGFVNVILIGILTLHTRAQVSPKKVTAS